MTKPGDPKCAGCRDWNEKIQHCEAGDECRYRPRGTSKILPMMLAATGWAHSFGGGPSNPKAPKRVGLSSEEMEKRRKEKKAKRKKMEAERRRKKMDRAARKRKRQEKKYER